MISTITQWENEIYPKKKKMTVEHTASQIHYNSESLKLFSGQRGTQGGLQMHEVATQEASKVSKMTMKHVAYPKIQSHTVSKQLACVLGDVLFSNPANIMSIGNV